MLFESCVVHVPTIEDYEEVVGYALENGWKWSNGINDSTLSTQWDDCENNTCIIFFKYMIKYSEVQWFPGAIDMEKFRHLCKQRKTDLLKDFK